MWVSIRKRRSFPEMMNEYFQNLERWAEEFEEPLAKRPSWNLRDCSLEPLRETVVTPTEVLVTVDLPFTRKSTVKVKPAGKNTLEVSAKMSRVVQLKELGVTHSKGEFHKYQSYLHIPVAVDMDKMVVRYKKGLIEIRLRRRH